MPYPVSRESKDVPQLLQPARRILLKGPIDGLRKSRAHFTRIHVLSEWNNDHNAGRAINSAKYAGRRDEALALLQLGLLCVVAAVGTELGGGMGRGGGGFWRIAVRYAA